MRIAKNMTLLAKICLEETVFLFWKSMNQFQRNFHEIGGSQTCVCLPVFFSEITNWYFQPILKSGELNPVEKCVFLRLLTFHTVPGEEWKLDSFEGIILCHCNKISFLPGNVNDKVRFINLERILGFCKTSFFLRQNGKNGEFAAESQGSDIFHSKCLLFTSLKVCLHKIRNLVNLQC